MGISSEKIFNKMEQGITSVLYPFYLLKHHVFKNEDCLILAYHNILFHEVKQDKMFYYDVSQESFQNQMQFLYDRHFNVIGLDDFVISHMKGEKLPERSVVITFDDGYKSIYQIAYPKLKKLHFPATVFLTAGYIGTEKALPGIEHHLKKIGNHTNGMNHWPYLSWEEIQEMSQNGIRFGSHTMTHPKMGLLNKKQIKWEITQSKRLIEQNTGIRVKHFSYPYSFFGGQLRHPEDLVNIKTILKTEGFEAACSTEIGTNLDKTDIFALKRIQIFKKDSFFRFKAKVMGAYNWVRYPQQIFRKIHLLMMKDNTNEKMEYRYITGES